MPSYTVIGAGFHGGVYYHPDERKVLHTSEPFKKGKKPSWIGNVIKNKEVDFSKPDAIDAASNTKGQDPKKVLDNDKGSVVTTL